jgi:hypothetical protein
VSNERELRLLRARLAERDAEVRRLRELLGVPVAPPPDPLKAAVAALDDPSVARDRPVAVPNVVRDRNPWKNP